jgi:hypothetical protein
MGKTEGVDLPDLPGEDKALENDAPDDITEDHRRLRGLLC